MKRNDIYTDGTYLINNPDWDEADAVYKVAWLNELLKKQKFRFSYVTEIGCGSGRILHELSKILPDDARFEGYDISPQAIRLAEKYSAQNMTFFHSNYLEIDTVPADCVIMFDVIEHVTDYYEFLERLKTKGRVFAFHIPLDLCCRTLLKPHVMLQQRDAVGHIHYFSREMVLWMLKDTGYEIIEWRYTKPIGDIVKPRKVKGVIKKFLRNASFAMNKNLSADLWGNYSMMILAR